MFLIWRTTIKAIKHHTLEIGCRRRGIVIVDNERTGMEQVDLLVVGGGKAGKSLAMAQAKKGWKVAMVERQYVGGTCINVACIPTKSLVASARRMADTRSDATFGVEGTEGAKVNPNALRAHKEGVVGGMVAAHEKMFEPARPCLLSQDSKRQARGLRKIFCVLRPSLSHLPLSAAVILASNSRR